VTPPHRDRLISDTFRPFQGCGQSARVPQLPSMPWPRGQPSPAISRRCASPFRCRSLILIYLFRSFSTPICGRSTPRRAASGSSGRTTQTVPRRMSNISSESVPCCVSRTTDCDFQAPRGGPDVLHAARGGWLLRQSAALRGRQGRLQETREHVTSASFISRHAAHRAPPVCVCGPRRGGGGGFSVALRAPSRGGEWTALGRWGRVLEAPLCGAGHQ
jgi:hypothetical protein